MTTRHVCPNHGTVVPRARGIRLTEILGVLVIALLTCGAGGVLAIAFIPLARRRVCPLCGAETMAKDALTGPEGAHLFREAPGLTPPDQSPSDRPTGD